MQWDYEEQDYTLFEDFHATYHPTNGGHGTVTDPKDGPGTVIRFVKDLLEQVQFSGYMHPLHIADGTKATDEMRARLSTYSRKIESIHIYTGLCFILTREQPI